MHKSLVLLACLFLTTQGYCADLPPNFPKELAYQGQPINPLCFYLSEASNQISLAQCTKQAETNEKITGQNKDLIQKGYIGFDYAVAKDIHSDYVGHGYSYYKVIGSANGLYTVYTINSGGGSGDFTSLFLVKRDTDIIELTTLASGDRCNGGLFDVTQKDQTLSYRVNLTAFDFLTLANQNPHKLRAYDDLAACAACCAAVASYTEDFKEGTPEPHLSAVDLGKEPITVDTRTPYQLCFDTQLNQYKKDGKTLLRPQELKKFVSTFNQHCATQT